MEISVLIINTGLYEICQNIIFIRRTNKLSDWQAHFPVSYTHLVLDEPFDVLLLDVVPLDDVLPLLEADVPLPVLPVADHDWLFDEMCIRDRSYTRPISGTEFIAA